MMSFKVQISPVPCAPPLSDPRLYDLLIDLSMWSNLPAPPVTREYRFTTLMVSNVMWDVKVCPSDMPSKPRDLRDLSPRRSNTS